MRPDPRLFIDGKACNDVFFMNRLMHAVRGGIRNNNLDDIQSQWTTHAP